MANPATPNQQPKQEAQKNQQGWKIFTAFVLGLVIGLGAAWLYVRDRVPAASPVTSHAGDQASTGLSSTSSPAPQSDETDSSAPLGTGVSVSNQFAGESVTIDSVTIPEMGWVVIYEDRLGQPGNALGAARLDPGMHEQVVVHLLRNTVPGTTYHAVLHADNGDRVFNLSDDYPLRDQSNTPIMATFMTQNGSAAQ